MSSVNKLYKCRAQCAKHTHTERRGEGGRGGERRRERGGGERVRETLKTEKIEDSELQTDCSSFAVTNMATLEEDKGPKRNKNIYSIFYIIYVYKHMGCFI